MRVSAHKPLAFALQDRVIARTAYRACKRGKRLVWRNKKQRRLCEEAWIGRMFPVADGWVR